MRIPKMRIPTELRDTKATLTINFILNIWKVWGYHVALVTLIGAPSEGFFYSQLENSSSGHTVPLYI